MRRYSIHATAGPVTALAFTTDSTAEVLEWLRRHGPGTLDLVATDRDTQRSTRIQRGA